MRQRLSINKRILAKKSLGQNFICNENFLKKLSTKISSNLSAGTLAIEMSGDGEKIFTNCGASESFGKNPEYLRYSAAHSTIILQNTNISEIKEGNPHIKFPQSVVFRNESNNEEEIFDRFKIIRLQS